MNIHYANKDSINFLVMLDGRVAACVRPERGRRASGGSLSAWWSPLNANRRNHPHRNGQESA